MRQSLLRAALLPPAMVICSTCEATGGLLGDKSVPALCQYCLTRMHIRAKVSIYNRLQEMRGRDEKQRLVKRRLKQSIA